VDNQADLTIGCVVLPIAEAKSFGVVTIDANNRIQQFTEKPLEPSSIPGDDRSALVSMGVYIFDTKFLISALINDSDKSASSHDFGKNIIPELIEQHRVFAYPFVDEAEDRQAYWRDVGTVDSYWKANMELIEVTPELNLYDREWPIWTYQERLPPAKFVFSDQYRQGQAHDSIISEGCIVSGADVSDSIL
jgi:glucose-1-phosphate adenylyltransferase